MRRLRQERGIALPLAMILIVVIGVMGAGLLVFVTTDLRAVTDVNRGQKAFETADAGVQAAKRQLYDEAEPESYNGGSDDVQWSESAGGMRLEGLYSGATENFSRVTIEHDEDQEDEDAEGVRSGSGDASSDGGERFKVTATGNYGDAKRRIEAVFSAKELTIPTAYYASGDIDFNGDATSVNGIGLFAERNILNLKADNVTGEDRAYGDWETRFNCTPRSTSEAGVAALGTIDYESGRAGNYGERDLDKDSDPSFKENTWEDPSDQPDNEITFPFDTGDESRDAKLTARLRQKAKDQGNYVRKGNDESFTIDGGGGSEEYPEDSNPETVYFVEFASDGGGGLSYGAKGEATYKVNGNVKGTLVVVNGNLVTDSPADDFEGAFVVRDPDDSDGEVMNYENSESFNVRGMVNVEGNMSLRGDVDGVLPASLEDGIPGLNIIELESWRELYE